MIFPRFPILKQHDMLLCTSLFQEGCLSACLKRYWIQTPCTCVRNYSDNVKDHFNKPRNVGSFDKNEKNIGTSIVGKASCGDVIKLQLKFEGDVIKDARFKAFGCGSAIASSSYATELIKGKTCDEALKIKNSDIASHLNLPPVKIHCSLLAEDAIKHAIKNYKEKVIN